ncbi:hypothetical protein [Nocardioides sp. AX2bis]|uniref:hypothetical protein n=1 Tax=Nocardioides sp. AX2bis TaxID=2653157 RepID=UPI00135B091B|nr:hypothetical protein [Nocardioides sp. AX2bis]
MGKRRGRGESISLREAYTRLVNQHPDEPRPTYEVFRRIRKDGHTNISDETAGAVATMLDVPLADVLAAAGMPPRLGRFELPGRADSLSREQRDVVLGVVDAILDAGADSAQKPVAPARHLAPAARTIKGRTPTQQLRANIDAADQETQDPGGVEPS